ncbi:MAG: phytanoyl-CoA dioxygenase [Thiotrichales bacterium]|nr:phytanoyl-CoA dioxygenase [Thiotrichales bacterium]|tara:strand:- start:124 stop:1002 length:879 start_codon:yes stop_codon:yes gene_type:complete
MPAATPDHVKQLNDHGFAVIRGFMPANEIVSIRAAVEEVYATGIAHGCTYRHRNLAYEILTDPAAGQKVMIQSYWHAWVNAKLERARRHPRYYDVLEPLLGTDIKQMANQIHWKHPGAKYTFYRYHQDIRFRNQSVFDDVVANSITTGLAVEPQTDANGTLRVFPGSHKLGVLPLAVGASTIMNEMTVDEELRAAGLDPADALAVDLEPGDLVMWTLLTVHGSGPNTSSTNRPFLLNSYVRAESSPTRGEWTFRDGVSVPLGPTPHICKLENLADYDEPVYDDSSWIAEDLT